jgi:hypothetical protein
MKKKLLMIIEISFTEKVLDDRTMKKLILKKYKFIYLFIYHQQSETPTDYILKN